MPVPSSARLLASSSIAAALFLTGFLLPATSLAQTVPELPAPPSLIVKLAAGLSADEQAAVIARNGGVENLDRSRACACMSSRWARINWIRSSPATGPDSQVVRAEVNKIRQSDAVPSDPLYTNQWSLPKISWDLVFGISPPIGTSVVAVLDTGIDATHPDLSGNVLPGTSILDGSNGVERPQRPRDDGGRDRGCRTNTVPAEGIAGVGYTAVRLMPVTVLDVNGLGQDSDVIAGVIWAADHGADVILMAFSNPGFSESLQEAIDYAWSNNIVLVAAVGNDGLNSVSFPAGDRGVIGVSATDDNDQLAAFSNYGQSVFLAAPGTDILTTDLGGGLQHNQRHVEFRGDRRRRRRAAMGASTRRSPTASSSAAPRGARIRLALRNRPVTGGSTLLGLSSIREPNLIMPSGAAPVGSGGPFVGPYRAAGNATISGTVKDSSNNPTVGATVACATVCTGTSNIGGRGAYSLSINFPRNNGTVSVTASATNFQSQTLSGIVVSNGNTATANFNLIPKHPTTTSWSPTSASVTVGDSQLFTITVSDIAATGKTAPTGTVTFSSASGVTFNPTPSCTLSPGSTSSTCSVTVTGTSTTNSPYTLTAAYNSDATHATSSGTGSLTVTPHTTTTGVSCTSPVIVGVASSCTITVTDTSSGATAPTGIISLTASGAGVTPTSTTCALQRKWRFHDVHRDLHGQRDRHDQRIRLLILVIPRTRRARGAGRSPSMCGRPRRA